MKWMKETDNEMLLSSSILHEETQADHMKDGNEGKNPRQK